MPRKYNKKKKTYETLDLQTCRLKEIDQVLEELTAQDNNNQWAKYFRLFQTVKNRELYKEGKFSSFTSWLASFCSAHSISEQRAWCYKRAGEVYESFRENDLYAPTLEEVSIAPETLVNIDKSAIKRFGGTEEGENKRNSFKTKYINQAVAGSLTRDGSKALYRDARKAAERAKNVVTDGGTEEKADKVRRNTEKADSIKRELAAEWGWLGKDKQQVKTNYSHSSSVRDFYAALPEFDFSTPGESTSKVTADVLILENLTTPKGYDVNIHSVEIKADPYDLIRDEKYIDYRNFSDFLWLCAPEEVLLNQDIAPDVVPENVGIIAYRKDEETQGVIKEENGRFVRDEYASVVDANGEDQLKFGAVPKKFLSKKLYIVRSAEKNLDDEKKTESTLRWWALRRR